MPTKLVTSFEILIQKAKALGVSRKRGEHARTIECLKDLKQYEQLVLKSDRALLGMRYGDLNGKN